MEQHCSLFDMKNADAFTVHLMDEYPSCSC